MTDYDDTVNQDPNTEEHEPYGDTEKELAFKLLAAHAMVDRAFFSRLRDDTENAAAELRIALTPDDVAWIKAVNWDQLEEVAEPTFNSLTNLTLITNSW